MLCCQAQDGQHHTAIAVDQYVATCNVPMYKAAAVNVTQSSTFVTQTAHHAIRPAVYALLAVDDASGEYRLP